MTSKEIPTIVGKSGESGFVPLVRKDSYRALRGNDATAVSSANYISIARHDLLGPLRRIISLTDFLSEDLGNVPVEESRDQVQKIRSQAKGLSGLLDDLDRYERAHHCESPEMVPLGHVIDTAIEEANIPPGVTVMIDTSKLQPEPTGGMEIGIDGKPAALDFSEPDIDNIEMYAERRALFFCLVELLKNAATHRRKPFGSIRLGISLVGEMVEVTVEDDGIGVAEEHREIIFEPLRKIHVNETTAGNGMGLAIVRRIAESRGGSIDLAYSTSHGSSFKLRLPSPS